MSLMRYKYRTAALLLAAVLAASSSLSIPQPAMAADAAPFKEAEAANKSTENTTGEDKKTGNEEQAVKTGSDEATPENAGTNSSGTQQTKTENAGTNGTGTQQTKTENAGTNGTGTQQTKTENAGTSSSGTQQTKTENAGTSSSGTQQTNTESTTEGSTGEKSTEENSDEEGTPAASSPYDSPLEFKYIYTKEGVEDLPAERAANKAQPPQTNIDPAWPQGPSIGAAGAVVMDADSGEVLYAKNMYMHLYPASITKVMTALLAYENLRPTDKITFSENAVFGIERGSSNIGMDVDESITVEEALYGLMVASANEVAVALGERVSGSETAFVNLMNLRAEELGCRNTHFVTTNGLHDKDHYTCAYDMALIAREAYRHPDLIEYMSQTNYHFEASDGQPDDFWIGNTNSFLNGVITCDDVAGGKTGYTDEARETLVTFAERDGKRLICVIMREEPPYQYYETIDLLDYAYDNFDEFRVAREENRFTMQDSAFLSFGTDIFGNSRPPFTIDSSAVLMLPKNASFRDLTASIIPFTYEGTAETASAEATDDTSQDDPGAAADTAGENPEDPSHTAKDGTRILGRIQYKYHEYDLGTVDVLFDPSVNTVEAETGTASSEAADTGTSSNAASTAAASETADVNLPKGSSRAAGSPAVPEEVHGIRSLFFALVHTGAHGSIYLNILLFVPLLLAAAFLLCVIFWIRSYFAELKRRRSRKRRRAARAQQQSLQERSLEERYTDLGPSGGRSFNQRTSNERSSDGRSSNGRSSDGRSSGSRSSDGRSSGRRTSGNGSQRQHRPG